MIAHLRGRADALVRAGWTLREAEWLALICLHIGVFLRSQYLAFHRPDQSSARQPLRPPVPQARRRRVVEPLPAPHLPESRRAAHLSGARGRARPTSPAGRAGDRATASAVLNVRPRSNGTRSVRK